MKNTLFIALLISTGLGAQEKPESWYTPPAFSIVVNPLQAIYKEYSGALQFRIAKNKMITLDAGYGFGMNWGEKGLNLGDRELRIPVYAKRSWLAEGPVARLGFSWFQPSRAVNANTFIRAVAIYRQEAYPRQVIVHRFYGTENVYRTDEEGSISVYGLQALFGVQDVVGHWVGEFFIGIGVRAKQYDIERYSVSSYDEFIGYEEPLVESKLRFVPSFQVGIKGGFAFLK